MKYILFSLAAIFFIFAGIRFIKANRQNQGLAYNKKPALMRVAKSLIDVGEKKQRSVVRAVYVIYNSGDEDLKIQTVTPDCHCTVASFSKAPIGPNDSSEITLQYDAAQPGVFQSSAVVTSNSGQSNVILILRGSIAP
jgi:hypothetical protein